MNIYGVIMAGGMGTRFWPLSRQETPKQLLNLTGNEIMINEAVDRLAHIADKKDIFIVANAKQALPILKVVKGRLQPDHILSEPTARNTAACIGYAAMKIVKKYGDGIMVVTPSDHYIKDTAGFVRILNAAVKAAEDTDKLITIGITPTFPSTGFGYIKFDKTAISDTKIALEFHEKPDSKSAKSYIESGAYVWNSGMFVWKASVILAKFKEHAPDIYADLEKIGNGMFTEDEQQIIENVYRNIRNISVDYAIMEPSALKGDVLVIPAEFGWNDVGSWDMMDILHTPDENKNVLVGDVIAVDVKDTVIYANGKTVAAVGIHNLIIVETSDAVLVCRKDKAQDVKKIVDELNATDRSELL